MDEKRLRELADLPLKEARFDKLVEKFLGKTLKARTDIMNFGSGDIPSSEPLGLFMSEQGFRKEFLWMRQGYTQELVDAGDARDGILATEDKQFDLTVELIDQLLRARLIEVK